MLICCHLSLLQEALRLRRVTEKLKKDERQQVVQAPLARGEEVLLQRCRGRYAEDVAVRRSSVGAWQLLLLFEDCSVSESPHLPWDIVHVGPNRLVVLLHIVVGILQTLNRWVHREVLSDNLHNGRCLLPRIMLLVCFSTGWTAVVMCGLLLRCATVT